jgi:hypothetical protein
MRSPEERAANQEMMRVRLISRKNHKPQERRRRTSEDKRFSDRLRFGCKFWKPQIEPKSLPPSTWPMLEDAVRRYGIESLPRTVRTGFR